jgi:hypothetical protein
MSGKVRAALIKLILDIIPASVTGTIKSVDESDYTCVVLPSDGGPAYESVRLKASIDNVDGGMVSIPDVNSEVVISPLFNDDHAFFVSRFSKVKKWHLKTVSGKFIEIVDTGGGLIKLNGDSFGGLTKAGATATKIAALEADLNKHKAVVAAIIAAAAAPATPVTTGMLAGFFTGATYTPTPLFTPTTQANLENTNVKHG